ncbi:MAG: methionine synthase [Elusimicrobia bacterium]|nr:methionine synthase [Candidatus Liberimonas magnetica]
MIEKGTITAIGSWPHKDVEKITDIIIANFKDMPVWPQLPKTGFLENMYVQYSEGLPCIVTDAENEKIYFDTSKDIFAPIQTVYENYISENYDYFAISEQYAKGLYAFKKKIGAKGKIPLVKGQVLGPVSLGLSLTDENKRLILYNEQLSDAVLKACICKAAWQAKYLKDIAEKVVIFLDEPYLVSFGSAYVSLSREQVIKMLNEVIDKLHELDVITGIHCCGNTDWSILMDSNVDIINFDAYDYSGSILLYPEKTEKFLSKEKYFAWGIVPTAEDKTFSQTPERLFEKLKSAQDKLASTGVNKQNISEKTILTPACGTGSLSEKAAEKVIELLKGVSEIYRKTER